MIALVSTNPHSLNISHETNCQGSHTICALENIKWGTMTNQWESVEAWPDGWVPL